MVALMKIQNTSDDEDGIGKKWKETPSSAQHDDGDDIEMAYHTIVNIIDT